MAMQKASNSRRANPEERGVLIVRWNDEGCSATKKLDFLRSHLLLLSEKTEQERKQTWADD